MLEEYEISDDYNDGEELRAGIDAYGRVGEEYNEDIAAVNVKWNSLHLILNLPEEFSAMQRALENIPNLKAKNPEALVLSYYCIVNGRIDRNRFLFVSKNKKLNVRQPDILRYCRLWLKSS